MKELCFDYSLFTYRHIFYKYPVFFNLNLFLSIANFLFSNSFPKTISISERFSESFIKFYQQLSINSK